MTIRFDPSLLLEMLTYARPCGSDTEAAFIARYIAPLGAVRDCFMNWRLDVGEVPSVLWSCHTDTVHRREGHQTLHVNREGGYVQLSKRSRKGFSCLGADDTTGVALCVQMVQAGVPGRYIFHHGEEVGGLGSSDLAEYDPGALTGIRYAIALDRKGYSDVITHQFDRCCSDAFAWGLADQLNTLEPSFAYRPCPGIFTDTAHYAALVPECTNLSVGYFDPHSRNEWQDLGHVERLFAALCRLDVAALPVERDPVDADYENFYLDESYADIQRALRILRTEGGESKWHM